MDRHQPIDQVGGFALIIHWWDWSFDPPVVIVSLSAAVLYILLSRQFGWNAARATAFFIGVCLTVIVLESPLHRLGECCLLAAHMVQHMVLMLLAPPLVIWGLGDLAGRYLPVAKWLTVLVQPTVTLAVVLVNLYFWHIPAVHVAALKSEGLHNLQHVLFVGTGLQFWWRVVSPSPLSGTFLAQAGARLIYLISAGFGMMPLGIILLGASAPLYPRYSGLTSVFAWSPLADQQMAALIMLFGGGAILIGAVAAGFFVLSRGSTDRPTPS